MTRLLPGLRFTLKPAGDPERHLASGKSTQVQVRSGAMMGIPVAANGGFAPRPSSAGVAVGVPVPASGAFVPVCAPSTPASLSFWPSWPAVALPVVPAAPVAAPLPACVLGVVDVLSVGLLPAAPLA